MHVEDINNKEIEIYHHLHDNTCYVTTKEEMCKIVGHKIHHNCMMHGFRPKDKEVH